MKKHREPHSGWSRYANGLYCKHFSPAGFVIGLAPPISPLSESYVSIFAVGDELAPAAQQFSAT